jgi:phosphate:Na+ symporter
MVKEKAEEEAEGVPSRAVYLDERLLNSPTIAVMECDSHTVKMALLAKETVLVALKLVKSYNDDDAKAVCDNETVLDLYEDNLGTYLVKISSHSLSDPDSKKVSKLLHTIGNFERLSDHAVNILKVAEEMNDKKISFSNEANEELGVITNALKEIIDVTSNAFVTNDISLAKRVEPLEQVIDKLISKVKSNHITRLQGGNCTLELGFILSDLLTNYERISDHCSNIAVAIIETAQGSFETHEYLNAVKTDENEDFAKAFEAYSQAYQL